MEPQIGTSAERRQRIIRRQPVLEPRPASFRDIVRRSPRPPSPTLVHPTAAPLATLPEPLRGRAGPDLLPPTVADQRSRGVNASGVGPRPGWSSASLIMGGMTGATPASALAPVERRRISVWGRASRRQMRRDAASPSTRGWARASTPGLRRPTLMGGRRCWPPTGVRSG